MDQGKHENRPFRSRDIGKANAKAAMLTLRTRQLYSAFINLYFPQAHHSAWWRSFRLFSIIFSVINSTSTMAGGKYKWIKGVATPATHTKRTIKHQEHNMTLCWL